MIHVCDIRDQDDPISGDSSYPRVLMSRVVSIFGVFGGTCRTKDMASCLALIISLVELERVGGDRTVY